MQGRTIIIYDKIILYTTGCPKCKVLKQKLDAKGIVYEENNSEREMIALGIKTVPVLCCDGTLMEFKEAVDWVNEQ